MVVEHCMQLNILRESLGNPRLRNKTLEDMKVIYLVVGHLVIYGLIIEGHQEILINMTNKKLNKDM